MVVLVNIFWSTIAFVCMTKTILSPPLWLEGLEGFANARSPKPEILSAAARSIRLLNNRGCLLSLYSQSRHIIICSTRATTLN